LVDSIFGSQFNVPKQSDHVFEDSTEISASGFLTRKKQFEMFSLINLRKIAIALSIFAFVCLGSVSTARADTFSLTSGTAGTGTNQNVSGTITAGAGQVQITITNPLTNAQLFGVVQNVSDINLNVIGVGCLAADPIKILTTSYQFTYGSLPCQRKF